MKLFIGNTIFLHLVLSFILFSNVAVACDSGRVCVEPLDGINVVLNHVDAAIKSTNSGADNTLIRSHIMQALRSSKEINANDKLDRSRLRANGYLKKARTALKKNNITLVKSFLDKAREKYNGLKKLL